MSRLLALKLARKQLDIDRYIKLKSGEKIHYSVLREEIDYLIANESKLRPVSYCRDCKNWSGTKSSKRACCFPKEFTSFRNNKDFCSNFIQGDGKNEK